MDVSATRDDATTPDTVVAGAASIAINVATGHAVRAAIFRVGLSVSDVADAAGMSRISMYRKLAGKRSFTVPEIVTLSLVLSVEPADLVRFPAVA